MMRTPDELDFGALQRELSGIAVDSDHLRLTLDVLRWTLEYELFGSPRARREQYIEEALVASTFGRLCAPPDAGYEHWLRAGRFTAIFLYLDDTTNPEVMSDERWGRFYSELVALVRSDRPSPLHRATGDWLRDLSKAGTTAPQALADFRRSFVEYCESLDEERRVDFTAMNQGEFLRLRRATIFVRPFLDHWRVSAGIDVSTTDPQRAELDRGQDLARDLIILANDLGSVERDTTSETTEMSTVVFYAQQCGGSVEQGAAQATAEYNALLATFRRAMRPTPTDAPWFEPLVALLVRVIEGNLETMLLLRQRYAASGGWLGGLDRLDDPWTPVPSLGA